MYIGPKLRSVTYCYCSFINICGYRFLLNKVKFLAASGIYKVVENVHIDIICHFLLLYSDEHLIFSIGSSAKPTKN